MHDAVMPLSRVREVSKKHASLLKNTVIIALASGSTAVLGFAYWWLAARTFPPDVVGNGSALIALMAMAALIGEFGMGTLSIGELGRWQNRAYGLMMAAALVATILSLIAGSFGLLLVSRLNVDLETKISLLVGCALTGFTMILDAAFIGMLKTTCRLFRQFCFSVIKLALIPVVVLWFSDLSSVLISWNVGLILSIILLELFMRWRGETMFHRPDFNLLNRLKTRAAHHYMLDIGIVAPTTILPYLVVVLLSSSSNAAFTVIWMILSVASLVPSAMSTVLFPTIRAEPDQYRDKMTLSFAASIFFAALFGLFIFLFSRDILELFNPAYAEIGGTDLRYLGFSMVGSVVKFHVCTAARLDNRMRQASLWFVVAGLFELTCVVVGCWLGGLAGLSLGWTMALSVEGITMMLLANPCGSRNSSKGVV